MSELEEPDGSSPFDLGPLSMSKNWMLDVFRDAVRSNNYPVIGLFFTGFGTIMKMAGSDFTIARYDVPGSIANPILSYLSLWAGLFTGGRQIDLGGRNLPLTLYLSDLLIAAGIGLMGSPLIGKLQSLVP